MGAVRAAHFVPTLNSFCVFVSYNTLRAAREDHSLLSVVVDAVWGRACGTFRSYVQFVLCRCSQHFACGGGGPFTALSGCGWMRYGAARAARVAPTCLIR